MNKKQTRLLTPRRIVILLCVILGLAHLILMGWTIQRRIAGEVLLDNKAVLEENLDQFQRINQEQINALQVELDTIQAEVAELRASFPEVGAAFDLYRRGNDMATARQVELLEITLISSESLDTVSGPVLRKQYNIEASGSLENCLAFMDTLEQVGLDTVFMEFASISPAESQCSLEISTLGYPTGLDG